MSDAERQGSDHSRPGLIEEDLEMSKTFAITNFRLLWDSHAIWMSKLIRKCATSTGKHLLFSTSQRGRSLRNY